jgi:hypothetical protein
MFCDNARSRPTHRTNEVDENIGNTALSAVANAGKLGEQDSPAVVE